MAAQEKQEKQWRSDFLHRLPWRCSPSFETAAHRAWKLMKLLSM